MGVKTVQPAATFGHPYGMNSTSPNQFLKSHAQEPLLPERKLPMYRQQCVPAVCVVISRTGYLMFSSHVNSNISTLHAQHKSFSDFLVRAKHVFISHFTFLKLVCSSQAFYREDATQGAGPAED